jgi:uncharacterized protein with PQ loop repeat
MIETILASCGWVGGILLAFCGIPQALHCYRKGNAEGIDWVFLMVWLGGELLTIAYVFPKQDLPLLFNYAMNIVLLLIIVRYKVWPRNT